jgi:hypothetical protein
MLHFLKSGGLSYLGVQMFKCDDEMVEGILGKLG